jgi:hypothetical protein
MPAACLAFLLAYFFATMGAAVGVLPRWRLAHSHQPRLRGHFGVPAGGALVRKTSIHFRRLELAEMIHDATSETVDGLEKPV